MDTDLSFSCLLFVDPDKVLNPKTTDRNSRATDQPIPKGYALLFLRRQNLARTPSVIEAFSRNGIEIIKDTEVAANRDARKLEAVEMKIKLFQEDPNIYFSCNSANIPFVYQMFDSKKRIKFSSCRFTPIEGRSISEMSLNPIKKLLEMRPDMPFRAPEEGTLLHFAVERGSEDLLDLLLKCGANINQKIKTGLTALHLAISTNNHLSEFFIQKLLDHGADINASTNAGLTPLHFATQFGWKNESIIELLLRYGADLHKTDSKGATALLFSHKNPKMLRRLVEEGANIDAETTDGRTVLLEAIEHQVFQSAEYILNRQPNATVRGNRNAFYVALAVCTKKHATLVGRMVEQGFIVGPDAAEKPNLIFGTIDKGLVEIVQQLLDNNVEVNQWLNFMGTLITPLHLAIKKNKEAIVRLLVERGADVNAESDDRKSFCESPLVFAVELGSAKIVRLLLGAKASLSNGARLLLTAVSNSKLDVLQVLLEEGLDPNLPDQNGKTCMSLVWKKSSLKVLDRLTKFGARCKYSELNNAPSRIFLETFLDLCPVDISTSDVQKLASTNRYEIAYHLVKLEALQPAINAMDSAQLEKFRLVAFKEKCLNEAKKLNEYIGNARIEYRDILTQDVCRIACYAKNRSIVNKMKLHAVRSLFPIYSSILMSKFQMGVRRRKLLDEAMPVLRKLFSQLAPSHPLGKSVLADEISEIISSFLSIRDLVILPKCLPIVTDTV